MKLDGIRNEMVQSHGIQERFFIYYIINILYSICGGTKRRWLVGRRLAPPLGDQAPLFVGELLCMPKGITRTTADGQLARK